MKWLEKWSYLILVIGLGAVYLSTGDNWKVYAEPLERVKSWYSDFEAKYGLLAEGGLPGLPESAGNRSAGDGGEGGQGELTPGDAAADSAEEGAGADSPEGAGTSGEIQAGEAGNPAGGNDPATNGLNAGTDSAAGSRPDSQNGVTGSGNSGLSPGEPMYMTVEDDYFSDAVFIGDSRTMGMFEYGGLEEISTFYASTGLNVYKMFDAEIVSVPGQKKKITIEEALQQENFAKIYLMLGINEMGTGTVETFVERYQEAVAHLQELQPDAIIYLQGIIKVTAERSAQGDYITNEGIEARNEAIARLADNERIFYLDVNPLICDETGGMVSSYTFDGVHLKAKYIEIWKEYLKAHAISS